MLRLLPAQAGLAQAFELLFQLAQFLDPLCHMADVFVQELIDFQAILSRCVFESQQDAYLIQCHVQSTAMADEGQALCMGFIVTITRQWSMLTHTFPMPTIGMFIEAPLIGCLGAW